MGPSLAGGSAFATLVTSAIAMVPKPARKKLDVRFMEASLTTDFWSLPSNVVSRNEPQSGLTRQCRVPIKCTLHINVRFD